MLEAGSARELMEMILRLQGKEQLTVVLILWLWWGERNKRKEEGRSRTVCHTTAMFCWKINIDCFQTVRVLMDHPVLTRTVRQNAPCMLNSELSLQENLWPHMPAQVSISWRAESPASSTLSNSLSSLSLTHALSCSSLHSLTHLDHEEEKNKRLEHHH